MQAVQLQHCDALALKSIRLAENSSGLCCELSLTFFPVSFHHDFSDDSR
jgi:hypothetical protein